MLRTWSIALAAMVAGTAQAADATLSLACKGTATIRAAPPLEYKPHPISTGLLINFTSSDGPWDRAPRSLSLRRSTSDNRMERGDRHLPRFQPISSDEHQWLHGPHIGDVGMVATSKAEVVDYSLKCTPTQGGDEG